MSDTVESKPSPVQEDKPAENVTETPKEEEASAKSTEETPSTDPKEPTLEPSEPKKEEETTEVHKESPEPSKTTETTPEVEKVAEEEPAKPHKPVVISLKPKSAVEPMEVDSESSKTEETEEKHEETSETEVKKEDAATDSPAGTDLAKSDDTAANTENEEASEAGNTESSVVDDNDVSETKDNKPTFVTKIVDKDLSALDEMIEGTEEKYNNGVDGSKTSVKVGNDNEKSVQTHSEYLQNIQNCCLCGADTKESDKSVTWELSVFCNDMCLSKFQNFYYRTRAKISRAYSKLTRSLDALIFEPCLFSRDNYSKYP